MICKTDREICEAATPGPWIQKQGNGFFIEDSRGNRICDVEIQIHGDSVRQYNAEFIAHFNPSKIKSLLDRIGELEKLHEAEIEKNWDLDTELTEAKHRLERTKSCGLIISRSYATCPAWEDLDDQ